MGGSQRKDGGGRNQRRALFRVIKSSSTFVDHGFDNQHSLRYITYDDMLSMGLKRGHARVIEAELSRIPSTPPPAPTVSVAIAEDITQTSRRAAYSVGGLTAFGGAVGFFKSGSKASLAAGLSTALVLGYAGRRMDTDQFQGCAIACGASAVL